MPFHTITTRDEGITGPSLYSSLEHLDNKDTYVRLLFVDFNSAFSTIIPTKLISNLCSPPLHLDPWFPDSQTADAIMALNTLQTNASTLEQIRREQQLGRTNGTLEAMNSFIHRAGMKIEELDQLAIIHVTGTKGKLDVMVDNAMFGSIYLIASLQWGNSPSGTSCPHRGCG
eukprot:g46691.t1